MRTNKRKIHKWPALTVAAAGLAVVCVPQAKAGLLILAQVDGDHVFQLASGPSGGLIGFNGQVCAAGIGIACLGVPTFDVSVSELSNSPGVPSLAELLSTTLQVKNDTGGLHVLEFYFGDTDFNSPVAPPTILLTSHIGGSVAINGAGNLMSFSSCVDQGNGPNTCGRSDDADDVIAGPGTPNITSGSFQDDKTALIDLLTAPYSISQYANIHLDAGSQINFSDNTTLQAATPEPKPLILMGAGLLALGLARRKSPRKGEVSRSAN